LDGHQKRACEEIDERVDKRAVETNTADRCRTECTNQDDLPPAVEGFSTHQIAKLSEASFTESLSWMTLKEIQH
jgi:hypothetical protein